MICAWKELIGILPEWMRSDVDRLGKLSLQELRLRVGKPPELVLGGGSDWLSRPVSGEDLSFCVNAASRYSPWTTGSAASGYITAPGGHRIGLCGEVTTAGREVSGIKNLSSVCIRVARDYPGIAGDLADCADSLLILGPPGSGKTTLLRDLIRRISGQGPGCIAVVDERGELFPSSGEKSCFDTGLRTDVQTGCAKAQGIDMVLRTMGPAAIAVDEITAEEDCEALLRAGWCGVRLLASAHATGITDLRSRPVYRKLWDCGLFSTAVVLRKDKSWKLERMVQWA